MHDLNETPCALVEIDFKNRLRVFPGSLPVKETTRLSQNHRTQDNPRQAQITTTYVRVLSQEPFDRCGNQLIRGEEISHHIQTARIQLVDHLSRICDDNTGPQWEVRIMEPGGTTRHFIDRTTFSNLWEKHHFFLLTMLCGDFSLWKNSP